MKNAPIYGADSPLGDVSKPKITTQQWTMGALFALFVHVIAAIPFLPAPIEIITAPLDDGPGIGVQLAPMIKPPEPVQDQIIEEETPALEERAEASPPPAPPAKPRETPDLPNIRARPVPELWLGSGTGSGQLTLEEYMALKDWLDNVRSEVLSALSYPIEARRAGISGSAQVVIVASRQGRIVKWYFRRQTGEPILDREIQASIDDIRKLPKFSAQYET